VSKVVQPQRKALAGSTRIACRADVARPKIAQTEEQNRVEAGDGKSEGYGDEKRTDSNDEGVQD
jgi:hypothetical protein